MLLANEENDSDEEERFTSEWLEDMTRLADIDGDRQFNFIGIDF